MIVKGCLGGKMIRSDLRSHCEVVEDGEGEEEVKLEFFRII